MKLIREVYQGNELVKNDIDYEINFYISRGKTDVIFRDIDGRIIKLENVMFCEMLTDGNYYSLILKGHNYSINYDIFLIKDLTIECNTKIVDLEGVKYDVTTNKKY